MSAPPAPAEASPQNPKVPLVEITTADGVTLALAYATANNFTAKPVYGAARCFLHPDAATCLFRARDLAAPLGHTLVIYDAYRPAEAQEVLWAHTPDPDFLAPPDRGSPHSRGVAVDLGLVGPDLRPLDMGTGFDAFTPLSHHGVTSISAEAQRHRLLLLGLMTAAGWDFYRNEWWHYQLFRSRAYPLLRDGDMAPPLMPR